MKKKLKIGIIGCGQIAQIEHLPYIRDSLDFELYSLCDLSNQVVQAVGEIYGIPAERRYTDMDAQLADSQLDAVIICTRDHYEPGLKAARAGKHMLIEKPLAYSLEQADEMIDAARKSGVVMMVGYMKRYDPSYAYFKKEIEKLKDITLVRVHDYGGSFDFTGSLFNICRGSDIPKEVMDAGAQQIQDAMVRQLGQQRAQLAPAYSFMLGISTHDSILMRHAFGMPEVLFADVHQNGFLTSVLDYGSFRAVFESGFLPARRVWDEKIWVYAPEKSLTLEFPWPYLKNAPTKLTVNENEPGSMVNVDKVVVNGFEEAYRAELQHFYDCITNGAAPLTAGEDARRDIQLAYDMICKVKL
ncbi:MAG: Gfo/Idh/MocA family oxidoreductase [Oscillospiraceae bacterium]|nr:Gfo/Idh/MocA family oxidoreductase [Oscillospiraceae bacterium]